MKIEEKLHLLRKQNGLSQEQLADKLGIARQTVSKWETGQAVPAKKPFRGPEIYTMGAYRYHCRVNGDFIWFQGYEEIYYEEDRIYECCYHGGAL